VKEIAEMKREEGKGKIGTGGFLIAFPVPRHKQQIVKEENRHIALLVHLKKPT